MTVKRSGENKPVYSTASGKLCPECGSPVRQCRCTPKASGPPGDGVVRVSRETKGRKGKGVTLITGLPLDKDAILRFAQELKQRLGSGGTVKDGVIEIQGDHRDRLLRELTERGFYVKRSGG
ncbi:translation initiation factor Sui1 [candidate division KSB1 bacterium]|nr:translation initiation factor Sui1 [candidate division KSB1 bacterium]